MKIVQRIHKKLFLMLVVSSFTVLGGITYATFFDKGDVLGSSFSVASSDIKILLDNTLGIDSSNLVDEIEGPSFENITPYWQQDHLVKIHNNGTADLDIISNSDYETVNDPQELRQLIYVEPLEWKDNNEDELVSDGEVAFSFGQKNIVKWKTEGINLGTIKQGETKGFILRFSTLDITNSKQGSTAIFDFTFNSTPAN